jgi:hypothetical protein
MLPLLAMLWACSDDSNGERAAPQCQQGVNTIQMEGTIDGNPIKLTAPLGNRAWVNIGNPYFDLGFGSGGAMTLTWPSTVANGGSTSLTGKTVRFGSEVPAAVSGKLYCVRAGSLAKGASGGGTFHLDQLEESSDAACFQRGRAVTGNIAGCWEQAER